MAQARAKAFWVALAANDDDDGPAPVPHVVAPSRREQADLSARQLGIFLTVYLEDGPHTVRGLATVFGVCKPAVRRALERLDELGLARRRVDLRDRRSVLVRRTELGWAFLGELRRTVGRAVDDAEWAAASRDAAGPRRQAPRPRPARSGPVAVAARD